MKKEYLRILVITVLNVFIAGCYFGVLNAIGLTERVYKEPMLFVLFGGGLSVLMIGVTLLIYKYVDKKPLYTIGFRLKKQDLLFSVFISLIVVLGYWFFIRGLEMVDLVNIKYKNAYISSFDFLYIFPFFFGWLLAALCEEITNRAYFYANLRHLQVVKLLIVSSLIFALMHVFKGLNLFYFIMLFSSGISFMYIYIKTGAVWVGTIIHATMNLANSFFMNEDPSTKFTFIIIGEIQEAQAYPLYLGFSLGVAVLIIIMTGIFYRDKEKIALEL